MRDQFFQIVFKIVKLDLISVLKYNDRRGLLMLKNVFLRGSRLTLVHT